MLVGEEKAWEKLEAADPVTASENAMAEYWEDDDVFVVPVFGQAYLVNVDERKVKEIGVHSFHLEESTHFDLLVPLYLASCAAVSPTGKHVAPQAIPGGQAFFKGPHELPLEVIAHHFGSNPGNLIDSAKKLGGLVADHGDAAVTIPAFPKLPVTIILWVGDLEFPARAQMLLDETAPAHLPVDALWAALIMTAEALTHVAGPHH